MSMSRVSFIGVAETELRAKQIEVKALLDLLQAFGSLYDLAIERRYTISDQEFVPRMFDVGLTLKRLTAKEGPYNMEPGHDRSDYTAEMQLALLDEWIKETEHKLIQFQFARRALVEQQKDKSWLRKVFKL